MAKFEVMVDGRNAAKVASEDEVRSWLRSYREEHEQDDPDAAHVQIRCLSPWSWLTGGKLVDRDEFVEP